MKICAVLLSLLCCKTTLASEDVPGVLLTGPLDKKAIEAIINRTGEPAKSNEIVNGLILTRLDAWLKPNATVGQVNTVLNKFNAKINTSIEKFPFFTLSLPPGKTKVQVEKVIKDLMDTGLFTSVSIAGAASP